MDETKYEDILEPRRTEFSNYVWINRTLNAQVAVHQRPRPSPQSLKDNVFKTEKISELILELSKEQKVDRKVIEKQITLILEEIGYTKNLKVIRYLGYTLTKIFLKVCSGIFVNYEAILDIKSKMGHCPVVFVPTHRSYADFIIFSYVCFYYDIEVPAIAAGMDFQGMMGIGEMLRNTGAFFMRRSYNDDHLYWTTFKEYINQLVCKGDLPIEFFIEGTRSRSNKSVSPKYGLINMILKAYFLKQVPDILFVPVSINYDRILEESLFGFELLGIPKPKESTSGFFKSMTILKEKFGNVYFHFGDPISARDFLGAQLDRAPHNFGPIRLHEISDVEKRLIPSLAYEIIRRQQQSSVVSYFNLIALILNNNVTRGQEFTGLKELSSEIDVLRQTLKAWGASIFDRDIQESIKECLLVHGNLIYCDEGRVGLVTKRIVLNRMDPKKLKAHSLSGDTISYSMPYVMLQIYANPVLHYLVDAALVVIILRSPGNMPKDDLFRHFCTLRAIFSYEFVLLESWYNMHFEEALSRLTSSNIIKRQDNEYDISENSYLEEVLISSIQPFILSYYVVTEILQKVSGVIDEKTVLGNVQLVLENAINEKKMFIHPYCMALDTLGNCLTSLGKMGVVKKTRQGDKNVYKVNGNAVGKLKANLETYIPSFHVIKSLDIFLHIKSKI